jgi:hypothetical protein
MTSKLSVITAITLTAALSMPVFAQQAATPAASEAARGARVTLVDPLKDFGTVPKGTKLDWAFTIRNSGDTDLQILSVQPTCGCTVAEYDKVIKPGQTGRIVAHVDTAAFAGPISKAVNIQTNDANTPNAQVTINAIVKPYVEAHPAGFARFSLLQGDVQTQTIILYSEEEAPFEIKAIEVPGDYVKVTHRKIENPDDLVMAGRPGQNQYALDITFGGPTANVGPLADRINVHTNSKHQPEYQVSLSGVVRPTLTVNPSVLNFGEITAGDDASRRQILIQSNDRSNPGALKVVKADASVAGIKADVKATEVPGQYEVIVNVAKGARAGAIDGELKIETTDAINPVVIVPLRGSIK